MIKVAITVSDGSEIAFDFPESPSEINLSQKVDYETQYRLLLRWVHKHIEADTFIENRAYYLYMVAKVISEFLNLEINDLMKLDPGIDQDEHGELLLESFNESLKDKKSFIGKIDLDSFENSMLIIYDNIHRVINMYEATLRYELKDNFNFSYKGKNWQIPYIHKSAYNGEVIYDKLTTGQSIEILEIKRKAAGLRATMEEEQKDKTDDYDPYGNIEYTEILSTIALLVREVDSEGNLEQIPLDSNEMSQFLRGRTVFFSQLDMQTGLDIAFFLMSTMLNLKNLQKTFTSSTQ